MSKSEIIIEDKKFAIFIRTQNDINALIIKCIPMAVDKCLWPAICAYDAQNLNLALKEIIPRETYKNLMALGQEEELL